MSTHTDNTQIPPKAPDTTATLRINRVNRTYPNGVQALRDVELNIGCGLFGLLGPNGAGKSSLMRTIATLQSPDSGSVTLDDVDIFNDPRAHRRRLGYLPQDFGVYPRVSAFDLLEHIALLKGIVDGRARRHQIEALLIQTNLWDHRRKAVGGFSGGMRQRFGIAQALLGDPRLVIVDEPTAGLDPEERNRFHNLLSEIGENVIVILSTHIVEDVRQLCPKMAILQDGSVVCQGTPDELMTGLHGRVWSATIPKQNVTSYRESMHVLSAQLHAGLTRLRVLSEQDPGAPFSSVEPELEDVYFSVVTPQRRFPEES